MVGSLVRKRAAVQFCSLAQLYKALRKVKPFFYVLEGTYRELIHLFFKSSIFFQVSRIIFFGEKALLLNSSCDKSLIIYFGNIMLFNFHINSYPNLKNQNKEFYLKNNSMFYLLFRLKFFQENI